MSQISLDGESIINKINSHHKGNDKSVERVISCDPKTVWNNSDNCSVFSMNAFTT